MTNLRAIAEQLCGTGYAADKMVVMVERAMRLAIEATRRWAIWRHTGIVTYIPLPDMDEKLFEIMLELVKAEAKK